MRRSTVDDRVSRLFQLGIPGEHHIHLADLNAASDAVAGSMMELRRFNDAVHSASEALLPSIRG
jgi:2-phospho-L-lactate transferase/gluconeogenesis factor (CofD/UPF0052 family)